MAQVLELFQSLSNFYARHLTREQVDELFEDTLNKQESKRKGTEESDDDDSSEDDESESISNASESSVGDESIGEIACLEDLPIVKRAAQNSQVTSILLELCSAIRELRASNSGYDNTYDCWDRVITVSPRDQYLTFIYTLLRLGIAEPSSKIYRKLTLASARAYILSLTIPGSKGFHIFDDKMIEQAVEVFHLVDAIKEPGVARRISDSDVAELWVNLANFCDDLKIMFRYVHFEEYKDVKNAIIWELNKLMFNNHTYGYANTYAATLHSKCFEIYDEIANAHNGDPEDTLMKIMKITCCLHVFPPKPKRPKMFGASIDSSQFSEHISDWFVAIINKSPRVVTKILTHYIQYVVTNQLKGEKDEKARFLDYAAKYDAALYTKCNESNLDFLLKAASADEVNIRTNAIEILTRIILIESKVNWEVFRHEISSVPREVHAIKELFVRILDVNNSIKLKSLGGLQQACLKGTPDAVKIMAEGLKFASFDDTGVSLPEEPRVRFREIRYERPMPIEANYSFEGHELLKEEFSKLPNTLYYLLKNNTAHVRRSALLLLETAALKNPFVIYKTKFVQETSKLGSDASLEVRKQALHMIDSILNHYPNCYPVIYAWSQIIVPLFKDSDAKLIDQAWERLRMRVFDNIRGIDTSNQAEHFMPWAILRVLLSTQQRHFLQACILEAMNKKILSPKILTLIESHTFTSNSTEAWIILSFIAGKMKCKDADSLISSFIKSTLEQSWNAGQNLQIILEVLTIWINEFSHSALNMAFSCIVNLMKSGSMPPSIVSKAFNFCLAIAAKSEDNKNSGKSATVNSKRKSKSQIRWIKDIHIAAERYLLDNIDHFHDSRTNIMSYLFTYSEVNTELFIRPDPTVVRFIHKYLEEYIDTPDTELYSEDVIFLNQMIILAGRFSIRDTSVANITCLLYRMILKKTERPTTVSNIIVCITDLCKKHTQTVELALAEIITKLRSPFLEIRLITFKNLAQMVLQDLVKLRGNLLLSLMAVLLDKDRELSNRATEFFITYLERKNSILFQTCLLECPFVYNGYMEFEGFESFSPAELQIESPLKGEENAHLRQLLYKAFMSEQEDIILLMFFENLKLIYAKILKEPTINSSQGHSTIKDMLFILKEICYQTSPKSDKAASQQSSEEQNDLDDDMPFPGSQPATTSAESQSKDNSKKKKHIPTMNQALALIEKMICLIPKISDHILRWDATFQQPIEDLGVAVCCRFESLTEFAQPQTFWSIYKKKAKSTLPPSKKRKTAAATRATETDSEDDEADAEKRSRDDETASVPRSCSDKPISLLFKPLLV